MRATRCQADRQLYRQAIRRTLENQPNLTLFQQSVDDLLVEDLNLNTNAFALAVAILPVMARNMAAKQPPKFTLLANSPRKIKPYQRFAKRLNRYLSHLYDMELTAKGAEFHYHKKPKHERTNLPLPETNE